MFFRLSLFLVFSALVNSLSTVPIAIFCGFGAAKYSVAATFVLAAIGVVFFGVAVVRET